MTLISVLSAGCVTSKGSQYCDIARVIRPSVLDNVTEETKRQIIANNEKIAKICGIKQ